MAREPHFDFVIVGAGSAGCVLANRLSADKEVTVCLVEAGPADDYLPMRIPPLIGMAVKKFDWGYSTAPQAHLGGRRVPLPRGRVLGGSSSINGMAYFRGHPGDFEDWATEGNSGWSYREILPYFVRSESNAAFRHSAYHGMDGPMSVVSIARPNPLVARFVDATSSLSLKRNEDFNAADPDGFGPRQATIRRGRRESMATAFLNSVKNRSNLTILTEQFVNRILIENHRATGIEIQSAGAVRCLSARREVLLCAGTYGSPAALMHSGVGDGAALAALGIETVLHLPEVGRNLRDHPSAEVRMRTRSIDPYGLTWRALPRNTWNLIEYLALRTGPISGNVFEATGFTRSRPELPRPDLQLAFMPAARSTKPLPFEHGYGIIAIAVRPKSRGSVTLASPDPRLPPVIDPNYLDHPDDIATLRFGLELGRQILAAKSFEKYRAEEQVPGRATQDSAQLDAYIRCTAAGVHHPSSTCRMGSGAVVDAQLRVHGMSGLRVIDASIFPTLVAGNTNAAVVMVAEKAADMILGRPALAPLEVAYAP